MVMQNQIRQLLLERQEMWQKMQKMQTKKKEEEVEDSKGEQSLIAHSSIMQGEILLQKQKRHRRTANEIERHYKCQVEQCGKLYGSEGSLNQHMKIKHPEFAAAQQKQDASVNPTPQSGAAQNPLT